MSVLKWGVKLLFLPDVDFLLWHNIRSATIKSYKMKSHNNKETFIKDVLLFGASKNPDPLP